MGNKPDWWEFLLKNSTPEVQPSLSLMRALTPEQKPASPSNAFLRRFLEPELNLDDPSTRLAVWCKAAIIPGHEQNASWMRRDSEGSIMLFSEYGNCKSEYGWQIDHILPRAKGGSNRLSNLQPLNWRNNLRKSDAVPTIPLRPRSL